MPSILQQGYSPMLGYMSDTASVLGGSSPAQLPGRPPLPQLQVRPPRGFSSYDGSGAATGQAIGAGLGILAALAAIPTGGATLAAIPAVLGAGAAGGALGEQF